MTVAKFEAYISVFNITCGSNCFLKISTLVNWEKFGKENNDKVKKLRELRSQNYIKLNTHDVQRRW